MKKYDDPERQRVYELKKRWREANRARVAAVKKAWRLANPDKVREHESRRQEPKRRYYRENREAFRLRGEKWRHANPERAREHSRKWYQTPRGRRLNADSASRRRARERLVETEKIDRLALFERDRGICHICGRPVPLATFTLDHVIPIAKGGPHTAANLKVACKSCNSAKRDRPTATYGWRRRAKDAAPV